MSPEPSAPSVHSDAVAAQERAKTTQIITALADLLTALPVSDRADIIATLPQEQRLAVAKLIAAKITEDLSNE